MAFWNPKNIICNKLIIIGYIKLLPMYAVNGGGLGSPKRREPSSNPLSLKSQQ